MYNPEHLLYFLAFATLVNLLFVVFATKSEPDTRRNYEAILSIIGMVSAGLGYIHSSSLFGTQYPFTVEFGRWVLGVASGLIVITLVMATAIFLQPIWRFWLKPKIEEWKEIFGW